jgi:hypothetical protein
MHALLILAVATAATLAAPHGRSVATFTADKPKPAASSPREESFGDKLTIDRARAVGVSRAFSTRALHGKPILVTGRIADVCQNKGCWLVVTDGKKQMRVTFKDYAFFVPMNSDGRTVLLEGIVSQQEISAGAAEHYAGESKSPSERKKRFRTPQRVITMEASGVVILGS